MNRPRITLVGEAMLELSGRPDAAMTLGHGGDALNIALHLARMGADVAFASALGDDNFSRQMRGDWAGQGVDCGLLLTDPDRIPGLYAISVDDAGERSFSYWRGESAARRMFDLPGQGSWRADIARSDWLAFSLISLAILPESGRAALLALAETVRAKGGKVAFDGNYRPRLWPSADAAIAARDAAIKHADIGLPTLEDEVALGATASPEAVADHWQSLGCCETIVKCGAAGCRLPDGEMLTPPDTLAPVDSSGAGDAFDAAYLFARTQGASPRDAALKGHELAGWTIMRSGAIPATDKHAPYI